MLTISYKRAKIETIPDGSAKVQRWCRCVYLLTTVYYHTHHQKASHYILRGGGNTYTIRQIADKYQFNVATIRRWIMTGKLEAKKINAQWRVTEEALRRFLGEN